jgi:hypothetical protein
LKEVKQVMDCLGALEDIPKMTTGLPQDPWFLKFDIADTKF